MTMPRPARWLLLPLALAFTTALAAPQLLFLGYDLRGLAERDRVHPFATGELPYAALDASGDWLVAGGRLYPADVQQSANFRLGYEVEALIASGTQATS